MNMIEMAQAAKEASIQMAALGEEIKNNALQAIKTALKEKQIEIEAANNEDIDRSEREQLDAPLLKRL